MKDEIERLVGLRILGIDWRGDDSDTLDDLHVTVEDGTRLELHAVPAGIRMRVEDGDPSVWRLPEIDERGPWQGVRHHLDLDGLSLDLLPETPE